ncbi:lactate dehydrogenase [Acidithiobacillus marinus]|uniref:site-specific DNA-methyltransferase (adenine-specific) n=1 Tax=Acidithiobacillus marinus TaxID=187490 RepID=A0A2I1DMU7_9PROT|nr:DNA methyltransferase [Acidithiobacillus marinus]PKY11203.1 lactate dehydrogenase [Acidithiobacillus marinus]
MNAVEIEQAITDLAAQPFDPAEFPYAFLEAFGNKATTIKRLRAGASNKSDLGGVLQTSNIHILSCEAGQVTQTLAALKASPATAKGKAKFILATDGTDFEAEDLTSGETVACAYPDFPDHFGFFLPLAGISTVRQISENAFDIRATSRLNRLYVELLKDNPAWGTAERRHDMNHFMARLIFCFFAEDTGIFGGKGKFTETVAQMSARDASNTHEVISTLFLAMNTPREERAAAHLPRWANSDDFPYVNGGLFSGSMDVPTFSKIARTYLLHVGGLDWTRINPDIFGSMIQALAEDEERGELGMHYTSVPNILKVLNPLFLDDLRAKLEEAGDNPRILLNLRKRMARIRVFDPACGSGNFLVIAYKEMRAIEAEINQRRNERDRRSDIPLTNFRGIELRDFPAEIARLALVIAEYQCDVLYRGQKLALAEFLPLSHDNWITCGNALRLDWLSICPPTGTGVKVQADDLFETPLDQAEINFQNEGGETYICGNPPYLGSQWRNDSQQDDMDAVFSNETKTYKDLDYVAAWYLQAARYCSTENADFALVATKTICQGIQVAMLWPLILGRGMTIFFAHRSFTWGNLAKDKAGVTCVIVGVSKRNIRPKRIFEGETIKEADNIGPYLIDMPNVIVQKQALRSDALPIMDYGNKPSDGGNLIFEDRESVDIFLQKHPEATHLIRRYVGSQEFVRSTARHCLWIEEEDLDLAMSIPPIAERLARVRALRMASKGKQSNDNAKTPHRFVYTPHRDGSALVVPRVTSENRPYLPCGFVDVGTVVADTAAVAYDAPTWMLAIVASRLHQQWIATVCVRLRTDYRYSNTLGWNTFPVPTLTEKNKADLTRCAEDILLAREHHFPATIAELYAPDKMPADLRAAHARNDEVLERIYIGRRFKNDTERLEKLFELYTKMTAETKPASKTRRGKPQ